MRFEVNKEKREITIYDENDGILLNISYFFDELVWMFYTNKKIEITRELDETFYDNLDKIMSSSYTFSNNGLSHKTEEPLTWLTDQYGDLEDSEVTDKMNRLIIEKEGLSYFLSTMCPMNKIRPRSVFPVVIAFSPSGNGYYTKNNETNLTFQDDIAINLYYNIINENRITRKRCINEK